MLTGRELDARLRADQANGNSSYPTLGRLLAVYQTGSERATHVDLSGVDGPVIGIFVCSGDGAGPVVSLREGKRSVLWFRSNGCNDTLTYSGQSRPLPGGHASATLTVTVPRSIRYAFVLEEVQKV